MPATTSKVCADESGRMMIPSLGFALSATAFLVLAAIQSLRPEKHLNSYLLIGACITHALWSVTPFLVNEPGYFLKLVTEPLRPMAWAIFFTALACKRSRLPIAYVALALLVLIALNLVWGYSNIGDFLGAPTVVITSLIAAAFGLVMAVSVFRSAGESERWALKALAFPLIALFGYDVAILTASWMNAFPNAIAFTTRGPISAITAVPIAIGLFRFQPGRSDFRVSHQAALYSTVLITLGAYFVLVGALGMLAQARPNLLSIQAQIVVLFVSALAMVFFLASGATRAKIKFFLSRHFFARKYDYQHEWRKLMNTLATEVTSPLENRVIRACANVLEVPGGALWLMDGSRPRLQATWNFRPPGLPNQLPASAFQRADGRFQILHGSTLEGTLEVSSDTCWLAVPLPQEDRLLGLVVLAPPRAHHDFDMEDQELMLLAARQCASQLAEKRATVELEENRQFARFNRQYAFVAHDIKNLMSQLSVMLKNFDRYADNPEFQQDMRQTVGYTVERMQYLVDRLNALREGHEATVEGTRAPLASAVQQAAQQFEAAGGQVEVAVRPNAESLEVPADPDRLVAIVGHLLANAGEATGPNGRVSVEVDTQAGAAIVDVIDDGPGMSADFIRDSLFSPFRSNKRHGFGVGAYQCREFARERGGDLDVISSPGSGTTMRLKLPALAGAGDDATLGATG